MPRQLRSGCARTFWPLSGPRIGFRGVQTSKHWTINYEFFGVNSVPKALLQAGEPEEIPCEGSSRDPPGDAACSDRRVAGASQSLRREIGWPS